MLAAGLIVDSRPLRVFIVEDHAEFAELLLWQLPRLGAVRVVGCVSSLRDALDGVCRCPVDLLLVDLHLEQASGLQVICCARQMSACPPAILAMTSAWSVAIEHAALAAGADHCFDKAELPRLFACVEDHARACSG